MKNKIFNLLLVLLFIIGLSLLIKNQSGFLYIENREKAKTSDLKKDFSVHTLNSILEDQMYFRDEIVNNFLDIFGKFKRSDKFVCFNRENIKVNNVYLDNSYNRINESILDTVANKAFNINEITNKYPDINLYIYNPAKLLKEPFLNSIWFPDNYVEYENVFLSYLGDKAKYKKMEYPNNQLEHYFNKTDWHYNVNGADKAYHEIVEMINEDVDIGSAIDKIGETEISPVFRGALVSDSENFEDIYDILKAGEYGIDKSLYDYYKNGELSSIKTERNPNNKSYNTYFGSNIGQVVFDYHNDEKKNILIFADSFIGPIKEVLSSHFNKSVMMCGYQCIETMSLDEIIKENDIDIILIMLYQQNLFYNGYYFIPIN